METGTGTIKYWQENGFGWIKPDDRSGFLFVLRSDARGVDQYLGTRVKYDLAFDDARGKRRAGNLQPGPSRRAVKRCEKLARPKLGSTSRGMRVQFYKIKHDNGRERAVSVELA